MATEGGGGEGIGGGGGGGDGGGGGGGGERRLSRQFAMSRRKSSSTSASSVPSISLQGDVFEQSMQSRTNEEGSTVGSNLTLTDNAPDSVPTSSEYASEGTRMEVSLEQEGAYTSEQDEAAQIRSRTSLRSDSYGEVNTRPIIIRTKVKAVLSLPLEHRIVEEPEEEEAGKKQGEVGKKQGEAGKKQGEEEQGEAERRGGESAMLGEGEGGEEVRSSSPSVLSPPSEMNSLSSNHSPIGKRKTRVATRKRRGRDSSRGNLGGRTEEGGGREGGSVGEGWRRRIE